MNKELYAHHPDRLMQPEGRREYDAVVFDVDSTLVTIEGLDWLAANKGRAHEVVGLTKKSMDGLMDFHEAMVKKMQLLAPTYEDFLRLGNAYCDHIVPGAAEVIAKIRKMGKEVWIMSGNFRPAVAILAAKLGIAPDMVLCNQVFFDKHGNYNGFDAQNPLARNGGKAEKIQDVMQQKEKRIVFIGDSATDLDVKGHVALFVGFGGVVERDIVKQQADYYINELNMTPLLGIVKNDTVTKPATVPLGQEKNSIHNPSPWKSMPGFHG